MRGPRLELLSDVRIVAIILPPLRDSYPNQHFRSKKTRPPKLAVGTCTHFTFASCEHTLIFETRTRIRLLRCCRNSSTGAAIPGWNSRSRVTPNYLLNDCRST